MCGIAGFIDYNKGLNEQDIMAMVGSLYHRGPDSEGHAMYSEALAHIGLGHRRLSIIDLSELGHQPMQKYNLTMIFNGEIYNYKEVKKLLQDLDYTFDSDSDSEVVLTAYKEWGPLCIEKFIGMFAFCIFDHDAKKIHLFRDRIGVKPLYIYEKDDLFLFASELKAFHQVKSFDKTLNENAIALYFRYGYVPNPICIFKYCRKSLPGHYITIDILSKKVSNTCYWDAKYYLDKNNNQKDETSILDEVEQLLISAFNYRMVADVPVGIFLSGGYDSSLVTAILQKYSNQKLNTFTIGFEDSAYDESGHAEKVANYIGTHHTCHKCSTKEAQDIVPLLCEIFDEPFADSSAIPTYLVSKIAAQHVKVVLSADGGDEIFAGYNRNLKIAAIHKKILLVPTFMRSTMGSICRYFGNWQSLPLKWQHRLSMLGNVLQDARLENVFDAHSHFLNDHTIRQIFKKTNGQNPQTDIENGMEHITDDFNRMLAIDFQSTLVNDMLVKVDRATMANSIEGREPLLDHRIYEYVASLPSSLKMKNGKLKYILKEISKKYLPQVIMERPKMGFGIPIEQWLKNDMKYLVDAHLSKEALAKYKILHVENTHALVEKLKNSSDINGQLWLLLTFQMWCKRWL